MRDAAAEETTVVQTDRDIMDGTATIQAAIETADVGLKHDVFLKTLIHELTGTLETVVGLEEAAGFINVVGGRMGEQINQSYKRALRVDNLSREQVAHVLVDLKARIDGRFEIVFQDDEKIVFRNHKCPFGDFAKGRPSLCMMTSNVFGTIVAENLGYGRVELSATTANGDTHCHVTVYLSPDNNADSGREYFRAYR